MDDAQLKPVGAAWTPATPSDAPAPVTPAHALATPATPASGLATPATPASGKGTPADGRGTPSDGQGTPTADGQGTRTAPAFGLAKGCEMTGCELKAIYVARHSQGVQLCALHNNCRQALLLQASKAAAPVTTTGGEKVGLKEYLMEMEVKDPSSFLSQLEDFNQKFFGSSSRDVGRWGRLVLVSVGCICIHRC